MYESVFVTLQPCNVTVGVIYRTPPADVKTFLDLYENTIYKLENLNENYMIAGDYNINLLDYPNDSHVAEFVDLNFQHGCIPLITKPTRIMNSSATCIDNIITNKPRQNTINGILMESISDHLPVFHLKHCNPPKSESKQSSTVQGRNLSKQNLEKLFIELNDTDFTDILKEQQPSQAATLLHEKIAETVNKTCPLITKNKSNSVPNQPWFTLGLKISSKKKNTLFKKAVKNNQRFPFYRAYRNIYNKLIKAAKTNYYTKQIEEAKNNPIKTWAILNEVLSKAKNKAPIPTKINVSQSEQFHTEIQNPDVIAEFFNSFFASVGERTSSSIENADTANPFDYMAQIHTKDSLFLTPTTPIEVINTAMSIKSKASTGIDGISNKLVKHIITFIAEPLAHIFNQSFLTGSFPDLYKIAKVIPLFKSGDKNNPTNYRPISLLPAFAKILEKLMHKRLISFLTKNDIIIPSQYGFLKGHSTEQAMLEISHRITEAIEQKQFILGIFLDLSKAFDTIDHNILLSKLHYYGIRGIALKWFHSYLSYRQQLVYTPTSTSLPQVLNYGVPQGSVLGPLLFLLYINDMPFASNIINFILFADDTTGLYKSHTLNDLFVTMNSELDKLNCWFAANKLKLNIDKTKWILFSTRQKLPFFQLDSSSHIININNSNIEQALSTKFLGLHLDNHLNFKQHISQTHLKITKGIYLLRRASQFLPIETLKTLYSTLILPHLSYGLLCWGGVCKSNSKFKILNQGQPSNLMSPILSNLHNLQKRAIRIVSKTNSKAHHIPLCFNLKLLKLDDLYCIKALAFFYDYYHNRLPPFFHGKLQLLYSRDDELFIQTKYRRTDTAACHLFHTLQNIWNPLNKSLKSQITKSKSLFLSSLKDFYISQYETWNCSHAECYSCKKK